MAALWAVNDLAGEIGLHRLFSRLDFGCHGRSARCLQCQVCALTHTPRQQDVTIGNCSHHRRVAPAGAMAKAVAAGIVPPVMLMMFVLAVAMFLTSEFIVTGFGAQLPRHDRAILYCEDKKMACPPKMGTDGLAVVCYCCDLHNSSSVRCLSQRQHVRLHARLKLANQRVCIARNTIPGDRLPVKPGPGDGRIAIDDAERLNAYCGQFLAQVAFGFGILHVIEEEEYAFDAGLPEEPSRQFSQFRKSRCSVAGGVPALISRIISLMSTAILTAACVGSTTTTIQSRLVHGTTSRIFEASLKVDQRHRVFAKGEQS
jgi:hypothetical protein